MYILVVELTERLINWIDMEQAEDQGTTREQILDAAYEIFMRKGINGAGTQEVTDKAGVNKAMLYYYFDSKENLFVEVFRKAVRESGLKSVHILEADLPLFDKIRQFIESFTDRLLERSLTVSFVMNELNRHPELLTQVFIEELEYDTTKLNEQLKEAADRYEIARIDVRHLLANITSLCLNPVVNSNFYTEILQIEGHSAYDAFLKERTGIIYDMTVSWLTT